MKQIIALGGGGFSMEPENLLLDKYILNQSNKVRPKVCFIPTASGDAENYITRFYDAFNTLPCEATHLSLFNPPTDDLRSFHLGTGYSLCWRRQHEKFARALERVGT